jgi:hypothetical protein
VDGDVIAKPFKGFGGNFSSTHLISCRQATSGLASSNQRSTVSSRALTEFTFQVAMRIRVSVEPSTLSAPSSPLNPLARPRRNDT